MSVFTGHVNGASTVWQSRLVNSSGFAPVQDSLDPREVSHLTSKVDHGGYVVQRAAMVSVPERLENLSLSAIVLGRCK